MKRNILLIEDDPGVQQAVRDVFRQDDYDVLTACSGTAGLAQASEHPPDLVIVDLGLPDVNGLEVTKCLRRVAHVPVLVLTAFDEELHRKHALQAGAVDYVMKPFDEDDLRARVRKHLRNDADHEPVRLGKLTLIPARRETWWGPHEVHLSPREFELLQLLASEPGRIFSRDELQRRVWGHVLDWHSNTLDVHITHLRGKFRAVGASSLIRSVRGVGYGLKYEAPNRPRGS